MIKQLGKNDRLLSPFVATKNWELYNIDSQELVLTELTGSEEPVALEFVDYTVSPPEVNSDCNIALEQQSSDLAIPEAGTSGSGTFFPDTEETNIKTTTFKRLIYTQIQKAFYNTYRNPVQIFGIDNIDFPLSEIDRFLANEFLMFTIPRNIFGDRITENSVFLYDNNFDDALVVSDDGKGNLVAGTNLFSKVQEVRTMGNVILSGTSSYTCPAVLNVLSLSLTASQVGLNEQVFVNWDFTGSGETGFNLQRSTNSGSTWPVSYNIESVSSSYYDDSVSFGGTYWYQIAPVDGSQTGSFSNTASAFIDTAPLASCIALSQSIAFPGQPTSTLLGSQNKLIAWEQNLDVMAVLDTTTNTYVTSSGGYLIGDIAFATDTVRGDSFYALDDSASPAGSSIIQFNITGTNVRTFSIGSDSGLLLGTLQGLLYTGTQDGINTYLLEIDPTAGTVLNTFTVGSSSVGAPNTYIAYGAANGTGQIYVDSVNTSGIFTIVTASNPQVGYSIIGTLDTTVSGGFTNGFCYNETNDKIYFGVYVDNVSFGPGVWEFNPKTLTVDYIFDISFATSSLFNGVSGIFFNSSSNQLYFAANGASFIYVYDATTRNFLCSQSIDTNTSYAKVAITSSGEIYFPNVTNIIGPIFTGSIDIYKPT